MEKHPNPETCHGCSADGMGRGGSVADNTPPGWHAIVCDSKGFLFFCGTCSATIGAHALVINKLVKGAYTGHRGLVKMGEKTRDVVNVANTDKALNVEVNIHPDLTTEQISSVKEVLEAIEGLSEALSSCPEPTQTRAQTRLPPTF